MARKKKPEDQPEEHSDANAANDDTFGLPEIEYQPINRDVPADRDTTPPPVETHTPPEPEEQKSQSQYTEEQPITDTPMEREEVHQTEYNTTYYNEEDEGNSPWPKILGIAALLLIIGAAGWYFGWKKPKDDAAALRVQQAEQARVDSTRRAQDQLAEEQRVIAAENQRKADSVASANATPPAGTIETLNERTGRYYVVVASSIDGDLIMDYAKMLTGKGVNAKIIAPYGNVKFHRLTVAEGDSFASAAQTAEQLKGDYSDAIWVIKY